MTTNSIFRRFFAISAVFAALFLLPALLSYSPDDMLNMAVNSEVINLCGPFGAWISGFLRSSFGYASFLSIPLFLIAALFFLDTIGNEIYFQTTFALLILFFSLSLMMFALFGTTVPQSSGGYIGLYFGSFLLKFTNSSVVLFVSIIISVVCLFFSGIPVLIKNRGVPMFTFLKGSSKKSIPLAQKTRIPEQKASFTHIPLHSEIKVRADAKLPWITKETIVETDSRPYNSLNHIPAASPFSTDRTFESSGTFLDEFKTDPDFNMDINEIELPLNDKRIFMKDALFDESLLNSNTGISNGQVEVVNNMQQPETGETAIFDAIAKPPANRFTIDDNDFFKDEPDDGHYCDQPLSDIPETAAETHFPIDQDDTDTSVDEDNNQSESLIDQSASIAKAITETPAKSETQTTDTGEIKEQEKEEERKEDISRLSAKNLRTEDIDDNEDENYRKKFHTYNVNDEYIIPSYCFTVSQEIDSHIWQKEIQRNSELLVKTLQDFGIESKVTRVNRGPVITLYEIQIAAGIKVNRVSNLSDDIAMALAASRVRIVAPIPGKSAVGVEIPNRSRETVTIGDIFNDTNYQKADM